MTINHPNEYTVTLGHNEVTVAGADEAEAIRVARRQLAAEMPRLWDMVYQTDDAKFQVRREN